MSTVQKPKKVWAFTHVSYEDLGSLEHVLRGYGVRPAVIMPCQSDIECLDPLEPDLLIVMGGPMGLYDADCFPHLHHEIRFVEARIAAGKPVLGICLGSQIIAKALGAKVFKGPQGMEIGWHPVSMNADGMRTPLKYLDQSEGHVMHWHGDTFELPQGAKLLASSDRYQNQAFSYGDNVLALQFHPEVTEVKLERWYARLEHEILASGQTIDSMRTDAHQHGDLLKTQNRLFFTEWLEQVAPHLVEKRHQPLVENA